MSKLKAVPDHLKTKVDSYRGSDNFIDLESVPRVSIRGSKFRLKIGEDETIIKDAFKVIILGVTPEVGHSHTYYEKGYTPDSKEAPDCSSLDGFKPDSWVDKPQHDNCPSCLQNQWGSAKSMSGKKAKACRQSKTIYLVLEKDAEEQQEPVVYSMSLSFLSLKGLTAFGRQLAQQSLPSGSVVTTLTFDEESAVPKVLFEITDYVSEAVAPLVFELAEKKQWIWTPPAAMPALSDQTENKPALLEQDNSLEKPKKKKKKKNKKDNQQPSSDLVTKWD